MFSEGSCDTEDWSDDAENSALHHRNKLHFKIYLKRNQLIWNKIIFHNITVYCIYDQINAALVSIRVFFKKISFFKRLNGNMNENLVFSCFLGRAQTAQIHFTRLKEKHAELVSRHADLMRKVKTILCRFPHILLTNSASNFVTHSINYTICDPPV